MSDIIFRRNKSGGHRGSKAIGRALLLFACALILMNLGRTADANAAPAEPAAPASSSVVPASTPGRLDDTNSQEILRSYLQLQEQLHATQLAIERSRKESDAAAARNAELLAARLEAIETSLSAQRAKELDAMQGSNKVMLLVAGAFAGIGLVAMLLMAYFQWRTVNRLADLTAALPPGQAGRMFPSLAAPEARLLSLGSPEQANQRLLGALEKMEQRIKDLEHTARPPLPDKTAAPPPDAPDSSSPAEKHEVTGNGDNSHPEARVESILARGQSLLNVDNAQGALECFDEALKIDAKNTDAWVKKGTALERLRKLDEAVKCYDQAIAADKSLTIAYLHKGGLFNRMERFNEALQCYEQALQAQETRS